MSRLEQRREEKGLSRAELARVARISVQYVWLLENADPPTPGLSIARRLAEALEVTVDDLWPAASAEQPDGTAA
jgi:transcriptional regulator with XRE-family HTH domain